MELRIRTVKPLCALPVEAYCELCYTLYSLLEHAATIHTQFGQSVKSSKWLMHSWEANVQPTRNKLTHYQYEKTMESANRAVIR